MPFMTEAIEEQMLEEKQKNVLDEFGEIEVATENT